MEPEDEAQKRITGNVSPRTHAAWRAFVDYHGVSVSGLLEALGRRLPPLPRRGRKPSAFRWDEVLSEARRIDAERRASGGRPPGT